MRFLIMLAAFAAMTASAIAQPPDEVLPTDGVRLYVGQNRTFRFDESIITFKLGADGVASAVPLSDREITLIGVAPGEVIAVAYGEGNKTVHQMKVLVSPPPAPNLVRIYGGDPKLEIGGHASYHCTQGGCGRANPDVKRGPDKTTITETNTKPDGTAVSISREYR
jgi:hypothetical protein